MTRHPDEEWMQQIARSMTLDTCGTGSRYLLHDRDTKFCASFRSTLKSGGVEPIMLPPRSPNLNAFAERWVRSIKEECLTRLILLSSDSLWRVLREYASHYHSERNHQGKDNLLLFPPARRIRGKILCTRRLGGLLNFYQRAA
jgi:putative transposase